MASLFPPPCSPLPDYSSLLIKGLYHASTPVHLLLSHTMDSPEARAILLSPHRAAFKNDLVDLNDAWISEHSDHGRNAAAAQRVELLYVTHATCCRCPVLWLTCMHSYPPTLTHLRLLLSMLHEYDDVLHYAKTTLDTAPTLLVLHEISQYFTGAQASDATYSTP